MHQLFGAPPTDACNERRLPSNLLFLLPTNTVASSDAPEVLFFLGISICFYQKANARVNVLSLEEEAIMTIFARPSRIYICKKTISFPK
jgi:hypothetical protein